MTRAPFAAPANIARAAKVVDLDDKGNKRVLRDQCPEAAMQMAKRFRCAQTQAHEHRTRNWIHLWGGTDWSDSDSHATSGTPKNLLIGWSCGR